MAVFDNDGDVYASISKRPDLRPIGDVLDEFGDEIFAKADSIIIEIDIEKEVVKRVFRLAEKYRKKVYAVVSNMSIALERRDFLQSIDCFVCNTQEAGILFSEDFSGFTPEQLQPILSQKVINARIPSMIVTMGRDGTGDAFCAGAAIGLTYGKGLQEACRIGTLLAASVIATSENVCPRFLPRESGLDMDVPD